METSSEEEEGNDSTSEEEDDEEASSSNSEANGDLSFFGINGEWHHDILLLHLSFLHRTLASKGQT